MQKDGFSKIICDQTKQGKMELDDSRSPLPTHSATSPGSNQVLLTFYDSLLMTHRNLDRDEITKENDSVLKYEMLSEGKERTLIVKIVTKEDLGSYFVRSGDLSMETELVGVGSFDK